MARVPTRVALFFVALWPPTCLTDHAAILESKNLLADTLVENSILVPWEKLAGLDAVYDPRWLHDSIPFEFFFLLWGQVAGDDLKADRQQPRNINSIDILV